MAYKIGTYFRYKSDISLISDEEPERDVNFKKDTIFKILMVIENEAVFVPIHKDCNFSFSSWLEGGKIRNTEPVSNIELAKLRIKDANFSD